MAGPGGYFFPLLEIKGVTMSKAPAPKRILFVDDEQNLRAIVKACLENMAGWEVLLAESGQEGLILAEAEQPDAILLDVMMPGMDGVSFLRQLRANLNLQSIPVVLFTAKATLIDPQRYLALSAKGAIAKPFDPLKLVDQLTEILGWVA